MEVSQKKCLIVGASSGIGAELARQLAGKGCPVALVARREGELTALAAEIDRVAGRPLARVYPHDVTHYEEVPALFERIAQDMSGLDLVIYSSGIMPAVQPSEYDFAKDKAIVEVNVLGAVAWLNAAADRFAKAKAGVIVGIGSVAGDRGRRGYPVYNASKAFLATYLEALRNRVGRYGVQVVTIKPGFIKTPMTEGLKMAFPGAKVTDTARAIVGAVESGQQALYTPGFWRWVMLAVRNIPSPIMQNLGF